MSDAAWVVAVALIAFFAGSFVGIEAEKGYVRKHCDNTQQFLIDKQVYRCTKP